MLHIRRMERVPLLTFASLANVGGGAAVITCIAVAWTVMAFRAESPLIVQAFNDFGFFLFLYTWPPFGIWMVIPTSARPVHTNTRIRTGSIRNVANHPEWTGSCAGSSAGFRAGPVDSWRWSIVVMGSD